MPKTVGDLFEAMRGFPAFALCFLFLALIWNSHYRFCRRYGLDDGRVRFLTCVLLFVVLFYIYPSNSSSESASPGSSSRRAHDADDRRTILQPARDLRSRLRRGLCRLFLLYLHAYSLREQLELSELEKLETRHTIYRILILIAVGLVATILALIPATLQWGGAVYALLFPLMRIQRIGQQRQRAALIPGTR